MRMMNWMSGLVALGVVSVSNLSGFGVSLGPFSLSLDAGYYDDGYVGTRAYAPVLVERRARIFDNPICYAIQARKLLEMTVAWTDKIDPKSAKTTIKRVTIEPYLFGMGPNGEPILRGKIVSDTVVKEVTVKYGDAANANGGEAADAELAGRISPLSKGKDKGKGGLDTVSVERISDIRVIERSQFNPPKDFSDIFKDGVTEVICTVSLSPASE